MQRVRIEPQTGLERKLLREKLIDKLNVNTLSYPYKFKNPLIQPLVNEYEIWEKAATEKLYFLQALTRGEAAKGNNQEKIRKMLGNLRRLDFEYLKALIAKYDHSYDKATMSFIEIKLKRNLLLAQLDLICPRGQANEIEAIVC